MQFDRVPCLLNIARLVNAFQVLSDIHRLGGALPQGGGDYVKT